LAYTPHERAFTHAAEGETSVAGFTPSAA
jgi:hypothetical protein